MKDEAPELILLLIFLNAIAWFLIAPVVASAPDHGWLWFIKDYQNLIAGLLAIVAALITVFAMMHVDGRQADRHRELMSIQLRKDTLMLDRYLRPLIISSGRTTKWVVDLQKIVDGKMSNEEVSLLKQIPTEFLFWRRPNKISEFRSVSNLLSAEFIELEEKTADASSLVKSVVGSLAYVGSYTPDSNKRSIESALKHLLEFQNCERAVVEHVADLRKKYIKATGLPLKDVVNFEIAG